MTIWALVILVMLMIPLLAIVIDSDFGKALARRVAGDPPGSESEMSGRIRQLEGEVKYLSESLEAVRDETAFLRSLLEPDQESRSLPPGD